MFWQEEENHQSVDCQVLVFLAGPLLISRGITNSVNDTDILLCFSSQPISNADFIVPVEIDGTVHQVLCTHNK